MCCCSIISSTAGQAAVLAADADKPMAKRMYSCIVLGKPASTLPQGATPKPKLNFGLPWMTHGQSRSFKARAQPVELQAAAIRKDNCFVVTKALRALRQSTLHCGYTHPGVPAHLRASLRTVERGYTHTSLIIFHTYARNTGCIILAQGPLLLSLLWGYQLSATPQQL